MDPLEIIDGLLAVLAKRCRECHEPATREGLYPSVYMTAMFLCDECEPPLLVYVQDLTYAELVRAAKKFVAKS